MRSSGRLKPYDNPRVYCQSRFILTAECRRYYPRSNGTPLSYSRYFLADNGRWVSLKGDKCVHHHYFIFANIEEARSAVHLSMEHLRENPDFQNSKYDEEVWFQIEALQDTGMRWSDMNKSRYIAYLKDLHEEPKGVWYK